MSHEQSRQHLFLYAYVPALEQKRVAGKQHMNQSSLVGLFSTAVKAEVKAALQKSFKKIHRFPYYLLFVWSMHHIIHIDLISDQSSHWHRYSLQVEVSAL